jgi:diadenosine tetraphosphatase ApaH/serine/threonine PP2A family protein phosphatase
MGEGDLDLDRVLSVLQSGEHLDERTIVPILEKLTERLYTEPNVLVRPAPITICGDIHGQLFDLLELFRIAGSPPYTTFLFMGDYVDRGYYSLETFLYLATLKVKFPDSVFLLRGNHECRAVNRVYGFYDDIVNLYGHSGLWSLCNDVFDLLPMAGVVANQIFSVHGGLSPEITRIEPITLQNRQAELPPVGPLCDLCWSDPDSIQGWFANPRGAGHLFGEVPAKQFCRNNGMKLITRAHQIAMEGYEEFFDKTVMTVWSAPNYMYRSGNKAAVLEVHENAVTKLNFFEAVEGHDRRGSEWISPYFA